MLHDDQFDDSVGDRKRQLGTPPPVQMPVHPESFGSSASAANVHIPTVPDVRQYVALLFLYARSIGYKRLVDVPSPVDSHSVHLKTGVLEIATTVLFVMS
jgi:hypothetical protein